MPSILANPIVRYGQAAVSAAVIVFIAFTVLNGTARWAALVVAAVEVVAVPWVLKRAA